MEQSEQEVDKLIKDVNRLKEEIRKRQQARIQTPRKQTVKTPVVSVLFSLVELWLSGQGNCTN